MDIKKLTTAFLFCIFVFSFQPAQAAESAGEAYLRQILAYTWAIFAKINQTPAYIGSLTEFAKSWLTNDDTDSTANNQGLFHTLGTPPKNADPVAQMQKLTSEYILSGGNSIPVDANDYTFGSFINKPLQNPDPRKSGRLALAQKTNIDPLYNYIKTASGGNLLLNQPMLTPSGNAQQEAQYKRLYQTITAVQSYNNYMLTNLSYEFPRWETIQKLVTQATDSNWLADVAAEPLGQVFRQILMYESQNYVLMTRLLQTQQQAAVAQAMTNTLLMLMNQNTQQLLQQAR